MGLNRLMSAMETEQEEKVQMFRWRSKKMKDVSHGNMFSCTGWPHVVLCPDILFLRPRNVSPPPDCSILFFTNSNLLHPITNLTEDIFSRIYDHSNIPTKIPTMRPTRRRRETWEELGTGLCPCWWMMWMRGDGVTSCSQSAPNTVNMCDGIIGM